jgi:hypothetical protein
MLDIYSQTFMTATRTGQTQVYDMPSVQPHKRLRFFARRKTRNIDLTKL